MILFLFFFFFFFFFFFQHGQTALDIAVRNRNNPALKKLLKYDCSSEILEEVKKKIEVEWVEF